MLEPSNSTSHGFDVEAADLQYKSLRPYVFALGIIYVITVTFFKEKLSKLVKNQVLLKDISLIWNSFNALFSILIVSLLLPECIYALFIRGWDYAVCAKGDFMTGTLSGFGMYIFGFSKIWELGDTLLLMLRGRPIIFLHAYHHWLVLMQVFFTYPHVGSFARLATMMNSLVHAIMYSYFALGTVWTPIRRYAKFVTIAQLLQFVIGCYGILYARAKINRGEICETPAEEIPFHLWIYFSFLVLFAHFFYKNQIQKARGSKASPPPPARASKKAANAMKKKNK